MLCVLYNTNSSEPGKSEVPTQTSLESTRMHEVSVFPGLLASVAGPHRNLKIQSNYIIKFNHKNQQGDQECHRVPRVFSKRRAR